MNVTIDGKAYEFRRDIRDDGGVRAAFNRLSEKTFGLNFENWYRSGYWGGRYIPHVLLDGERVAANISVNLIPINLEGRRKNALQLGTVMTDPDYRGRGLSRFLMGQILREWRERCDLVYLFANDSVLGFYPKFGFVPADEYAARVPVSPAGGKIRKLNMGCCGDRKLLLKKYALSNPFSALTMEENPGLLMFYCTQFLKDSVSYLVEEDAVVIAEQNGEEMLCYDLFCGPGLSLKDLLSAAAQPGVSSAVLGFMPKPAEGGSLFLRKEEDTTLFVLPGKENPFGHRKLMFPLLSHA